MDLVDLCPPAVDAVLPVAAAPPPVSPAAVPPPPAPSPSANGPTTLVLGGLPYRVRRLRLSDMGRLEAWIKRTVPHPVDAIKPHLEGLSPAEREALLQNADRRAQYWPIQYGSPAANGHFATAEGMVELLTVALQICQPSITREQVALLADELSMEELGRIIDVVNGVDRAKIEREAADEAKAAADGDAPAPK